MYRFFPILFIICFGTATVSAQNEKYFIGSSTIINDYRLAVDIASKQFPKYRQAVDKTYFEHLKFNTSRQEIYEIKVVVHVVYKDEVENISDEMIASQIEVLNEDFNQQNADTANLRPAFYNVKGNPGIRFTLDQVVRVQTNSDFMMEASSTYDDVNMMKKTAQGGSDPVDPEHYLNIWVCKIQSSVGQVLGYAFPPSGLFNWPAGSQEPSINVSGIVVDYRSFGRNGIGFSSGGPSWIVLNGRTTTHEVGHYLGLRHINGDAASSPQLDPCEVDDYMHDTPPQEQLSSHNCNANQNSCTENDTLPDMIENYMDYSSQDCQNTFTIQQADLMRNVLENQRNGLITDISSIKIANSSTFTMFPNPAKEQIVLRASTDLIKRVTLTSPTRKTIKILTSVDSLVELDISNLSPGIYFVSAEFESGSVTKRLVVD